MAKFTRIHRIFPCNLVCVTFTLNKKTDYCHDFNEIYASNNHKKLAKYRKHNHCCLWIFAVCLGRCLRLAAVLTWAFYILCYNCLDADTRKYQKMSLIPSIKTESALNRGRRKKDTTANNIPVAWVCIKLRYWYRLV